MVGVDQQHDRVPGNRFSPFVYIANEITGQPNPQTLRVSSIPGFVGHFLTRWLKPGNVRYVGAMDLPTKKKFSPLKYRLSLPDIDDRTDVSKKILLLVGETPV